MYEIVLFRILEKVPLSLVVHNFALFESVREAYAVGHLDTQVIILCPHRNMKHFFINFP